MTRRRFDAASVTLFRVTSLADSFGNLLRVGPPGAELGQLLPVRFTIPSPENALCWFRHRAPIVPYAAR